MASTMHPLAAEYLERLRSAAENLPREQRDELVTDIEAHLAEALPVDASEAQVRTVLDRLGDPAQIVETEEPGFSPAPASSGGRLERLAQVIVLIGGLVGALLGWGLGVILDATRSPEAMSVSIPLMIVGAVLGWAVGVVLLWMSPVWTVMSKLVGTLVVPGGLLPAIVAPFLALGVTAQVCYASSVSSNGGVFPAPGQSNCTAGPSIWLIVGMVVGWIALTVLPIAASVHLGRRAATRALDA